MTFSNHGRGRPPSVTSVVSGHLGRTKDLKFTATEIIKLEQVHLLHFPGKFYEHHLNNLKRWIMDGGIDDQHLEISQIDFGLYNKKKGTCVIYPVSIYIFYISKVVRLFQIFAITKVPSIWWITFQMTVSRNKDIYTIVKILCFGALSWPTSLQKYEVEISNNACCCNILILLQK